MGLFGNNFGNNWTFAIGSTTPTEVNTTAFILKRNANVMTK